LTRLCQRVSISEPSGSSNEEAMNIYFNESKNVWIWEAQGEQGEAKEFYEARLLILKVRIWRYIDRSYKIPFHLKEDSYQAAMEALFKQLQEDPTMARHNDSWFMYRAFAYAYRHSKSLACSYRRIDANVRLDEYSEDDGETDSNDEISNQDLVAVDFPAEELEGEVLAAALIAHLPEKLHFVAVSLMEGRLKKDIAEMMGVSGTMITKYIAQLRQDEKIKAAWAAL